MKCKIDFCEARSLLSRPVIGLWGPLGTQQMGPDNLVASSFTSHYGNARLQKAHWTDSPFLKIDFSQKLHTIILVPSLEEEVWVSV